MNLIYMYFLYCNMSEHNPVMTSLAVSQKNGSGIKKKRLAEAEEGWTSARPNLESSWHCLFTSGEVLLMSTTLARYIGGKLLLL